MADVSAAAWREFTLRAHRIFDRFDKLPRPEGLTKAGAPIRVLVWEFVKAGKFPEEMSYSLGYDPVTPGKFALVLSLDSGLHWTSP